jgi:hypothetical protein
LAVAGLKVDEIQKKVCTFSNKLPYFNLCGGINEHFRYALSNQKVMQLSPANSDGRWALFHKNMHLPKYAYTQDVNKQVVLYIVSMQKIIGSVFWPPW